MVFDEEHQFVNLSRRLKRQRVATVFAEIESRWHLVPNVYGAQTLPNVRFSPWNVLFRTVMMEVRR